MIQEIKYYISIQPIDRQDIMTEIHSIILEEDKTVVASVEPMMGKEMIVYRGKGLMKYALAGLKNYMSLHVMPIYGSETLYSKYKSLLPKANFQKGCINFDSAEKMPPGVVSKLIVDCSKIDLIKIKEEYLNKKIQNFRD